MRDPSSLPRLLLFASFIVLSTLVATTGVPQASAQTATAHAQLVMLGTGTPAADPERFGPATAVVVNDTAYIVDAGAGVVRRAASAARDHSIKALQASSLRMVFLTHLHSDHTVGLPDIIFSPWTLGRRVPLDAYGPSGTTEMMRHLLEAYRADVETRTNADGNQREFPQGHSVNAHDIHAGVVYKDANVTVMAFPTKHAMESYGYQFDMADRRIVISGDTSPTDATVDACHECDVLVHEVSSMAWLASRPPPFQAFAAKYHTTTVQLAELASRAKPRLLVLYHLQAASPDEALREIGTRYNGKVVVARDLDVY